MLELDGGFGVDDMEKICVIVTFYASSQRDAYASRRNLLLC
jgi:hypothetical protein